MNYKLVTQIFITTVIVVILGYDVWVYMSAGQQATVSKTIIEWGYDYPAFTFMMGFVMGHFFWQLAPKKKV